MKHSSTTIQHTGWLKIHLLQTFLFIFALLAFSALFQPLNAQWTSAHPGMEWRVQCTGRTTGHVIDIWATNTTNEEQTIAAGPFYVPGPGQPYVTETIDITVPAKGETRIPVTGYCFVEDILPAPAGTPLDATTWLTPDDVAELNPQTTFTNLPGFKPANRSVDAVIPKVPGYEFPLNYTLAPMEDYPQSAAALAFPALEQLQSTMVDMQSEGAVLTPFGNDPEKEQQAVIQHTLWMYSAAVEGQPYEAENLQAKIIDEFENTLQQPFANMSANTQVQIQQGIEQFQTAFMDVGSAAMVINPGETWYSTKSPRCICKSMSYTIWAYKLVNGKVSGSAQTTVTDNFSRLVVRATITGLNLKKGDRIMLLVGSPSLVCRCTDKNGTCPPLDFLDTSMGSSKKGSDFKEVPFKDISDDELDATQKVERGKKKEQGDGVFGKKEGSLLFEVTKKKTKHAFIHPITVYMDCQGDDCGGLEGRGYCESTVWITFK
jgi:hypothetical protein